MSTALPVPPELGQGMPDAAERSRALDPARSFIVQAPAGSGKTGLLIQRYLALLAHVDEPEEIVAITFTRKAAAEMRERLVAALECVRATSCPGPVPNPAHEKLTRDLACAVLQRDKQAGWHILDNPARLRIQTFDSLCASLTRQMPVLSAFGFQPGSVEDASDLYLEAARATLGLVEGRGAVAQDVERLLEHLDNDLARVEILLVGMLARRDHWLRHIYGKDRDSLEAALRNTRREAFRNACELYPSAMRGELVELVRYCAGNLANTLQETAACTRYQQLSRLNTFPGDSEQDAACWQVIAELLLTKAKEGAWRKQYTIKEGFPPESKLRKADGRSWKERTSALVSLLSGHDDGPLCQALYDIREKLPPPAYTGQQWEVLGSIMRLLPLAVAQLRLVFQAHNKVDFIEVAQGAMRALGEPESPTDLALALDYRIRHLLIDEFQDTSISQYQLVTRLAAGWERGDGRSILAVGDPMQSIYRFREAEVGVFLRARVEGIGNVKLQPITLSANFRSQRGIVDWVNAAFAHIMPQRENVITGAVPYTPSIAVHGMLAGEAVSIHPFFNDDRAGEAVRVMEIVMQARRGDPAATTAILVRNRSHLAEILPLLKEAGLRFQAIKIEGLGHRPVVQDLLILTRALAHPSDRAAWVALLRAPWCGLMLGDIHALVSVDAVTVADSADVRSTEDVTRGGSAETLNGTVWECLNDERRMASVSVEGRARLLRVREVLQKCMDNRWRGSLRTTVEAAWLALGGPACIEDVTDFEDAGAYLDYLEAQEEAWGIRSIAALEEGMDELFAFPDVRADKTLQIMTIHQAKGLEFDCVILPGLGRSPRSNDKKLFMWMESLRSSSCANDGNESNDLLLAPIQETGGDTDRIYSWLEKLDAGKGRLEDERLLYVAATRAKQCLHLLGSTRAVLGKDRRAELERPAARSLLARIWPVLEPEYARAAIRGLPSDPLPDSLGGEHGTAAKYIIDQSLRRLVSGWILPPPPASVRWEAPYPPASPVHGSIEYSWAGEIARFVGNIVHRWLQRVALDGVEKWDVARIHVLRDTFKHQLLGCGVGTGRDLDAATDRVEAALSHAVIDPRGRWLLGAQQDAHNELRVTSTSGGACFDHVIDRTFCDANGLRWVVDYKTSSHEGADLEDFLNREQERYRAQLDRYSELMRLLYRQPIRRGLYFPLLKGWREWGDDE